MDTERLLSHSRKVLERLRSLARSFVLWCQREPQRRVILFMVAFSPAMLTGYWISECAVNVPAWDGWERGALIQKANEGTLDFAYLTSCHIDHRPGH